MRNADLKALLPEIKEAYDCKISVVDEQIGRVLSQLEKLSLDQNTIIVFTSDHGEEFLEHGGTTHQGTVYRELLHVPLVFFVPSGEARRIGTRVRNFDIFPTLLELVGIPSQALSLDAISLKSILDGYETAEDRVIYTGFPWVRTYIAGDTRILEKSNGDPVTFDLRVDSAEKNPRPVVRTQPESDNIWMEFETLVSGLRERREPKVGSVESKNRTSESGTTEADHGPDAATLNQLRSLGYID